MTSEHVRVNRLAGRVAIVTGASRGIGLACSSTLAADGARVLMVARDPDVLDGAVASVVGAGGSATALALDVAEPGASERIVEAALALGGLDIVVANAGVDLDRRIEDVDDATWQRLMDVNLTAPFRLLRAAAPHLRASGHGRAVTIASTFALVGVPGWSVYAATKGGLVSMTRALAIEWGRDGVCVNAVCPGHTETSMTADFFANEKVRSAIEKRIPLRRIGQPSDLGGLVAYLASDDASFLTGQVITVDGGFTAA